MATVPKTTNKRSKGVKDFYHISFANECQICLQTCVKPRRLPCEHEFCKACLNGHIKELKTDKETGYFTCPSCNQPVPKPQGLQKSKWTKAFKIDRRTFFYTNSDEESENRKGGLNNNDTDSLTLRSKRNSTSENNPISGIHSRRTAVRFPNFEEFPGFKSLISSDTTEPIYWGGDISSRGDIVIPDWYNKTVKVFKRDGNFVNCVKLKQPPLDVTVVNENKILVSYGSVAKKFTWLIFEKGELRPSESVRLSGHLFSITRCGKKCLGVFENDYGLVTLATINVNGQVRILDIGQTSALLSSSSGIGSNKRDKKIYCTEKHNYICLDSGGNLKWERSYPYLETEHYTLGTVTCDDEQNVYVASEYCVLHMDADGHLVNVIPTKLDPYHVMVTSNGKTLIILGRNGTVEFYAHENDTIQES